MTAPEVAAAGDPRWAQFLDRLAETANVQASARAARLPRSAVYARKRRDAEFAAAMRAALADGYDLLEFLMLSKALAGELQPVAGKTPTGKQKRARAHDLATAGRILAAHREARNAVRAAAPGRSAEDVRAAIDAKLDAMRRRAPNTRRAPRA